MILSIIVFDKTRIHADTINTNKIIDFLSENKINKVFLKYIQMEKY